MLAIISLAWPDADDCRWSSSKLSRNRDEAATRVRGWSPRPPGARRRWSMTSSAWTSGIGADADRRRV